MIGLILAAAALAQPHDPVLSCTHARDPLVIRAWLHRGRIIWRDQQGKPHTLTGAPDEAEWSCLPADGRQYPEDVN